MMSSGDGEGSIGLLLHETLDAVAFVHDYIEFIFDDMILRALSEPTVTLGMDTYSYPDAGSRDALFGLIGRHVESLSVEENKFITLDFSGGASLTIPLDLRECRGPEAANFVPGPNQPIEVW